MPLGRITAIQPPAAPRNLRVIQCVVGAEKAVLTIHVNLLIAACDYRPGTYLWDAIIGAIQKGEHSGRGVFFPEEDPLLFRLFCDWLYAGRVAGDITDYMTPDWEYPTDVFWWRVSHMGIRLGSERFVALALQELQELFTAANPVVPSGDFLRRILNDPASQCLKHYIVRHVMFWSGKAQGAEAAAWIELLDTHGKLAQEVAKIRVGTGSCDLPHPESIRDMYSMRSSGTGPSSLEETARVYSEDGLASNQGVLGQRHEEQAGGWCSVAAGGEPIQGDVGEAYPEEFDIASAGTEEGWGTSSAWEQGTSILHPVRQPVDAPVDRIWISDFDWSRSLSVCPKTPIATVPGESYLTAPLQTPPSPPDFSRPANTITPRERASEAVPKVNIPNLFEQPVSHAELNDLLTRLTRMVNHRQSEDKASKATANKEWVETKGINHAKVLSSHEWAPSGAGNNGWTAKKRNFFDGHPIRRSSMSWSTTTPAVTNNGWSAGLPNDTVARPDPGGWDDWRRVPANTRGANAWGAYCESGEEDTDAMTSHDYNNGWN